MDPMVKKSTKIFALIMSVVMLWTGCSTAWITQAEQVVTVLLPAVANILQLIAAFQGSNVSAQDYATVKAVSDQVTSDLQLVGTLINQYNGTPNSGKAALLDKINSAIAVAQNNMSQILPALHIKDPALQNKVDAVVGLVLSELASLKAMIPVIKGNQSLKTVMVPMDAKSFKKTFNTLMTATTGNKEIDSVTVQRTLR